MPIEMGMYQLCGDVRSGFGLECGCCGRGTYSLPTLMRVVFPVEASLRRTASRENVPSLRAVLREAPSRRDEIIECMVTSQ